MVIDGHLWLDIDNKNSKYMVLGGDELSVDDLIVLGKILVVVE